MPLSITAFWLATACAIAFVVFGYCAIKWISLNPQGSANRLAAIFNIVFMFWAAAAFFWYSTDNQDVAEKLYKAFAWCWCIFPPLVLRFNYKISGSHLTKNKRLKSLLVFLLYVPAVVFSILIPLFTITKPNFIAGYWMLGIRINIIYILFSAHYFLYILAGIVVTLRARSRAAGTSEKKQLSTVALSSIIAVTGGFITDTVFLALGFNFPNMAIIWITILSIGMLTARNRFGFLAPFPIAEAPRILNALADMVLYLDESGKITWGNDSALKALGCKNIDSLKDLPLEACFSSVDIAPLKKTAQSVLDFYATRTTIGQQKLPVDLRAHRVMDIRQARGSIITLLDLSSENARKKAEDEAQQTGLLLEEFIAHSLDGITLTDPDGTVKRWNSPMSMITGIPTQDAIGKKLWDLLAGLIPGSTKTLDDEARVKRRIISALIATSSPMTPHILEEEIQKSDGTRRILQSSSFIIPLRGGSIMATITRDISEARQTATEMIERIRKLDHAQKMDAVGALTSGIAHDFNNTLGGIVGALSLIKMGIEDNSYKTPADMARELEIMERSAERAVSSVKRLLTLTKKRLPEQKKFKLNDALQRVVEFTSRSLDPSIIIKSPQDSEPAFMEGDPGQVEQLLLNLIINAEQAMTIMRLRGEKRGGVITITIRSFFPEPDFLASNPAAEKQTYWRVGIRDEGVGIPHHILPRIFDPFFTTKPADKSSGLGLAMVHSIATQHGGFVDLFSQLGVGTEFFIYLPASSEVTEKKTTQKAIRGSGLILLVDDDEVPRDTGQAILAALGYKSEAAVSGEEALEMFNANPGKWAAVVTDLRMTGIGGDEIAMRMKAIRPDLPIVMASGYATDDAIESASQAENFVFVQKPYTVAELGAAIIKASMAPG